MAKEFNIQGGYFSPPGFLKVETGGSHEENPNGGVQIGVDEQGIPNMLEEGEPVYDDYVYSDNIRADESILEQFNIPKKYAGKLYSEIADAYVDEAEDRPLDPISNNGLRVMLGRLADAQEQQKANEEQKELEEELANLSPEELDDLEAMISQQPITSEDVPIQEEMPIEQPIIPMMKNGGIIRKFNTGSPGRLVVVPKDVYPGGWKFNSRYFPGNQLRVSSFNIPLPSYNGFVTRGSTRMQAEQAPKTLPRVEAITPDATLLNNAVNADRYKKTRLGYIRDGSYITEHTIVAPKQTQTVVPEENLTTNERKFPTWPRYMGLAHNLFAAGVNMFQQPDKHNIPVISPRYPDVAPPRIVDAVYRPIDVNEPINNIMATNAGTTRSILDSGAGPSTGSLLLALDNNTTGNLGATREQVATANNNQRNTVLGINNQNEMQRANFLYQLGMNRAQAESIADRINMQNAIRQQIMNNQAEQEWATAVGAPLDYLAQGISRIGDENLAYNMVNEVYPYKYDSKSNIRYHRSKNGGPILLKKYKK